MKKETPGKVIITPRPPQGEDDGADVILKCEMPPMMERPVIKPEDLTPDKSNEKLPDLKKQGKDLKNKAVCKSGALKDKIKK